MSSSALRPWALAALGYLALAVALTWPLATELGHAVPGIPQVDMMDTAWLRLAVAKLLAHPWQWPWSYEIDAPVGYPVGWLVPNWLDHLTAAPLVLLLPWPIGDNLWWLLALAANGLAAHVLGRQEGGSHAAGALAGTLFACSEPVLREANLGHAPQAMLFASPLYLAALLRALRPDGTRRDAVAAGVWMAVAGVGYWYQGVFLAVLSLPLAVAYAFAPGAREAMRRLATAAAVTLALVAAPLALTLSAGDGMPDPLQGAPVDPNLSTYTKELPSQDRWTFSMGSDPAFPLRSAPIDRSDRVSLVLLAAAVVGARRTSRRERVALVVAAVVAAVLVLGPYLKWNEDPVLLGGSPIPLPGLWLARASKVFARLSWPERWGVVVPLALLPMAARALSGSSSPSSPPSSSSSSPPSVAATLGGASSADVAVPRWVWGVVVAAVVETVVLSGNAPLAVTEVGHLDGWRSLADARGAVLVLPIDRAGPKGPTLGLIHRAVGRPLATPTDVPPGAARAEAWEGWRKRSMFAEWVAQQADVRKRGAVPPEALDQLRADGISAVAIDATPGGLLTRQQLDRLRTQLAGLGTPVDYGSAVVWWLDDSPHGPGLGKPDLWREEWRVKLKREAVDIGPTIIRPVKWEDR